MEQSRSNIQWPGWEIGPVIGRGSFGRVYSIHRPLPGDKLEYAALKVISIPRDENEINALRSSYLSKDDITRMFWEQKEDILREYATLARMRGCANIVYCDDFRAIEHEDDIGWDIYIKMELLTPLNKHLESGIHDDLIRRLAMDLCNALAFCEKSGILHRDIKPANVFVAPDGSFKLGDFGIAKTMEASANAHGTRVGTPPYMAPEVFRGENYDHRADIYSLGLLLYELMNNFRRPFEPLTGEYLPSAERTVCMNRRLAGEQIPPPVHGNPQLQRIVLKACAFDPAQRYASAGEMLRDLQLPPQVAVPPADPPTVGTNRGLNNPPARFCQNCGTAAPPNMAFCVSCGAPLHAEKPPVRPPRTEPVRPRTKRKSKAWIFIVAAIALVAAAALILIPPLSGGGSEAPPSEHTHSWAAASCTAPKTCTACGDTKGSPAGHDWTDASCTAPKTCAVCGVTEGAPADHQWLDATVEQPKTCPQCGVTEGISLGSSVTFLPVANHSDANSPNTDDVAVGTYRDISGTVHQNTILFWVMKSRNFANSEHISYTLDGQYTLLTGSIYLGYDSDTGASGQIILYGDGNILYQSPMVDSSNPSVEFTVDISGVKELRIEGTTEFTRNSYVLIEAFVHK